MMTQILGEEQGNYDQFRDCFSSLLIEWLRHPEPTPKLRANRRKTSLPEGLHDDKARKQDQDQDVEELADFADYIAGEIFVSLPSELRTLSYHSWADDANLQSSYALPQEADQISEHLPSMDLSIAESLLTYGVTSPLGPSAEDVVARALNSYIALAAKPPPNPALTRSQATACELCGRDWIDLSYHHLIPRMVHAKVVKRGWHRADELQNVAWLCGACHRFVHTFATYEDLARKFYTVELLLAQEEVKAFASWVSRLRWKGAKTRVGDGYFAVRLE